MAESIEPGFYEGVKALNVSYFAWKMVALRQVANVPTHTART
jgi:hypothetical protein